MKIVHHWLSTARRVPSPNCDDRPDPTDISLVVLHCISLPPGEFGGDGIDRLFTNTLAAEQHPYYAGIAHLRVSAHLLIRRDGEIVQYVPFHRRAWHAGLSSYRGRTNCNDFSIGIELEGAEGVEFDALQYRRLNQVLTALMEHYPGLSPARMAAHSEIAPWRKTDPGSAFDWSRITLAEAEDKAQDNAGASVL
ncbi:1,6-anhydro-N-acetylmuramyl-L-alanine amidase AmpD [Candidatus Methylocalor cossyra]|uniref:1,6-anhydro-N-acetylmuramyl-L-alanine amidase AmpD n=1 Tax=Candidatus Methylocalor cossyra TaxID=3108543 RepID=A0ABM9NM99_9GAMM